MFDSAENLYKMHMGDARPGETNKDVMARKLTGSKTSGSSGAHESLHESIKRHGVLEPITIVHGIRPKTGEPYSDLQEGHHRVAAAYDINPKMEIPLEHKEPHDLW